MKKWKRLAVIAMSALMMFSSAACEILPLGGGESGSGSSVAHVHKAVRRVGSTPNCQKTGKLEHWECVGCGKLFSDKDCTNEIALVDVDLPRTAHDLEKHDRIEATATMSGNIEYYTCYQCGKYFADAAGKSEITEADITLNSLVNLVDFVVNVPEDRNPIILQLADPQVIDSSTMRTPDIETADLLSNNQKNGGGDVIHFCRDALHELGRRYFSAYEKIVTRTK